MKDVFVDTSYFIALVNTKDQYHDIAKKWAREIVLHKVNCHTSIAILFEIADGFSRLNRRDLGINLIENLINADNIIFHAFNEKFFQMC